MLAQGCGAADARLTASARSGIQVAGRGAGTGASTEHGNCGKGASNGTRAVPENDANAVAVAFMRFASACSGRS